MLLPLLLLLLLLLVLLEPTKNVEEKNADEKKLMAYAQIYKSRNRYA